MMSAPAEELISLKARAARAVKWNAVARIATSGVQLVGSLLLARLLLPPEFGVFNMALLAIGFMQELADGGMANAVIRDRTLDRAVLAGVFWMNVALGVVLYGAAILLAPAVAALNGEPGLVPVIGWLGLVFVIASPGNFFCWLLRQELEFRRLAWIEVASATVWLAATTVLALAGQGVMAMVWGYLVRAAVRSVSTFALAPDRRDLVRVRIDVKAVRERVDLLGFAGFQVLERSVYFAGNNVDFFVIGWLLGPEQLGYYVIGYNLVLALVRLLNPALTNVSFPALSLVRESEQHVRVGYLRLVGLLAAGVLPVLIGCALTAPEIVALAYGPGWAASAPVLRALCFSGIFYSMRAVTSSVLQVKGRADLSFYFNGLTLVVLSFTVYVGARAGGIQGVSVALALVSLGVLLPLDLAFRQAYIRIGLAELARAVTPAVIGVAVMAAVVGTVRHWMLPLGPLPTLGVVVPLGAGVYLGVLWLVARAFVCEVGRLIHLSVARGPTTGTVNVSQTMTHANRGSVRGVA